MPAKKANKNAKDGGVVAAVTKHGAKFSNGSAAKGPASAESTPPVQSPEIKPVAGPSPNGQLAASPLLDALSTASFSANASPAIVAADWAGGNTINNNTNMNDRGGFSGSPGNLGSSPGNLISLMGESPPTQPSSFEDPPNHLHHALPGGGGAGGAGGWTSAHASPAPLPPMPATTASIMQHPAAHPHPQQQQQQLARHHFVNSPPMSASPPTAAGSVMGGISAARRPLSFQMDGQAYPHHLAHHGYGGYGGSGAAAAAAAAAATAHRRSSIHSHLSHARVASHPPLPHQPQAHFYGAPDIDLDLHHPHPGGGVGQRAGIRAGERGYHFAFDSLSPLGADGAAGSDAVVVAGYEGGLDVFSVRRRGLELLAGLKGLRGGVYHAKILPWSAVGDGHDVFPLVAVVVHGPVLPPTTTTTAAADTEYDLASNHPGGSRTPPPPAIEYYQTSVEVYSLKTNRLVDVLLQAPRIAIKTSVTSPAFRPPPPTGALTVKADAGTIVVASGATGECWIYRQLIQPQDKTVQFLCAGKLWTCVQQSQKAAAADPAAPETTDRAGNRPGLLTPLVAINGRWIAYCPAAPSSQISLRAAVPIPLYGKVPGYNTMTPPQLPPISSELDLPISESVMNKIMRETTQELIQGAKWVGQQGLQAWNNYWNKPAAGHQQQPTARSPPLGSQPWTGGGGDVASAGAQQFPPTHGTPGQQVAKDPRLVSMLDAEALGNTTSLHPLATFMTPLGCSFLAFSPQGLSLFTASSKGDVQTVWDLMRIQYTRSSPLQPSPLSARQQQQQRHASQPGKAGSAGGVASSSGVGSGASGAASQQQQPPAGPRVRQVAQFSRMTVARIVDVAWSRPNGVHAAMLTERGTVHLLRLDAGVFVWPPPRRSRATAAGGGRQGGGLAQGGGGTADPSRRQSAVSAASEGGAGASTSATSSAVAIASSAFNSALEAARPLMARPRRSSTNVVGSGGGSGSGASGGGITGASIVDSASHGGKVIAASISHSLGKTGNAISQLRGAGENRVSLPAGHITPGCVAWVSSRRGGGGGGGDGRPGLFVLGEGLVRAYEGKAGDARKGAAGGSGGGGARDIVGGRSRGSSGGGGIGGGIGGIGGGGGTSRYRDFAVPLLPDDTLAPAVRRYLDPDEYLDLTERDGSDGSGGGGQGAGHSGGPGTAVLRTAAQAHAAARPRLVYPEQSFGPITLQACIPQAEIESSAPYQPFHTDRRVALFEYSAPQTTTSANAAANAAANAMLPLPSASVLLTKSEAASAHGKKAGGASPRQQQQQQHALAVPYLPPTPTGFNTRQQQHQPWAFGGKIPAVRLEVAGAYYLDEDFPDAAVNVPYGGGGSVIRARDAVNDADNAAAAAGDASSASAADPKHRALPPSAMERVLLRADGDGVDGDQIVITTRRRRGAGGGGGGAGGAAAPAADDDGFFEDDCEVLDFADQRV